MIENDIEYLQKQVNELRCIIDDLPYYLMGVKGGEKFYVAVFSSSYLLERFVRSCYKNKHREFKEDSIMGKFNTYDVRRYYVPKDLPLDIE